MGVCGNVCCVAAFVKYIVFFNLEVLKYVVCLCKGCDGCSIWLNPFATVLFTVCSAVTVECCVLYPCCVGVFSMFSVM